MSVTIVNANAALVGQGAAQRAGAEGVISNVRGAGEVGVTFQPHRPASTPLGGIGDAAIEMMKSYGGARQARDAALSNIGAAPAGGLEGARAQLLGGPASLRPGGDALAPAAVQAPGAQHAMEAMTRSFDYAVESALIVKTGSQFSTSVSSLMRGQ